MNLRSTLDRNSILTLSARAEDRANHGTMTKQRVLQQYIIDVASRKKMSEKSVKPKNSLEKQRELYNKAEMRLFLEYRARDGLSVQIWRPKCPKPQGRVI